MHTVDLAITAGYILAILAVGFAVSRAIGGFRDFFVAGGRMTAPVLVCSLVSTYYGLDVLFGGSEVGYLDGVVGWFFYTRPYYVAVIIAALLVAGRVRKRLVLSLSDVAARAYGKGTQAVVAMASFFYSLPLLALMGLGLLLDVTMGWPFATGVLLGATVALAYTLLGGLLAGALTDTVQFTLMCVTLGVATVLVLEPMGGMAGLQEALPESYFEPRGTYPMGVLVVFSLAALSVLIEPAFYQRIVAARSLRDIIIALSIGVVLWAAFDWVVTVLGMAAQARGVETEPRYALLTLVLDVLPIGLKGLFVAGVLATAMSTIDSYLLIAGANLSYDLYRPFSRRPLSDEALLRLTRWCIVFACLVAVGFALFFTSMVSAWVFMATVLVGAGFVPILAALWLPGELRPAAGFWSSLGGLGTAVGVFVLVLFLGETDPEWGTRIWRFIALGREWEVWQEYALLAALPVSALAFLLGQWFGSPGPGSAVSSPTASTPDPSPSEAMPPEAVP